MKSFFAAIRFLTIVPVPERWCGGEAELRRSLVFFPVVGLLIGLLAAGAAWYGARLLPPAPLAVLLVILYLAVSGGLHMDGLADTADGFFSSRPRDRVLEIMHDSRSGPMAIIAIVCLLLLKVTALASFPAAPPAWVLILIPVAGRCEMVIQLSSLPYARSSGGLATAFCQPQRRWPATWAIGFLALAAWFLARQTGLAAAALTLGITTIFSIWCYRKIGGFTGDTLGASCEIAEVIPPLVALAAVRLG